MPAPSVRRDGRWTRLCEAGASLRQRQVGTGPAAGDRGEAYPFTIRHDPSGWRQAVP
jgi:hypothetical protein